MPIVTENTDLIIQYAVLAAGQEDEYPDRQLGPIHLIKYVYLADLCYARKFQGESFTGTAWIFYKFGPWSQEVNARIEPALHALHANRRQFPSDYAEKDDWVRWDLRDDRRFTEKERALPPVIAMNLKRMIHTYGTDTPSLLGFVYNTAPMLSAAPHEYLDLSVAIDAPQAPVGTRQPLRMESLTAKKKKKFGQDMATLRASYQKRKASTPLLINPVANPRYDEVYKQGVAWMDELAGDKFSINEITAEFSSDVWKSTTRKGEDVPG